MLDKIDVVKDETPVFEAIPPMTLSRRLVAECLGTAFLLAIVVGSGIMAERYSGEMVGLALLANILAIGVGLSALIFTFGSISGAHFNPAVTLSDAWLGNTQWGDVLPYILVQLMGAFVGVAVAHLMFGEPIFSVSQHVRTGMAQWGSEFVATFGLLVVVIGCSRSRPSITPFAVGFYIISACWFTASNSFVNPALTLARGVSDTFVGIRPIDTLGFIIAQLLGAAQATLVMQWMFKSKVNQTSLYD